MFVSVARWERETKATKTKETKTVVIGILGMIDKITDSLIKRNLLNNQVWNGMRELGMKVVQK